jgi:hypothetical protein
MLKHFGCKRHDLHVCCTEFASYGAEDTGAAEFAGVVEEYASVVVETDVRAVSATDFFFCTYNNCL